MTRLLAVAMLALVAQLGACGGAQTPAPATRTRPPTGSGSAALAQPADAPPSDAECDELVVHAVGLEMADRPADQQLAEPERTKVVAQLQQEQRPACRELSRDSYRCMLAASTASGLAGCK